MGITPTKGDTHFPVIWARFSKKHYMYRTVSNRWVTPPPIYIYIYIYIYTELLRGVLADAEEDALARSSHISYYMYRCMYVCIYIHIEREMHTCICIYIYIYMYTHIYTYTYTHYVLHIIIYLYARRRCSGAVLP